MKKFKEFLGKEKQIAAEYNKLLDAHMSKGHVIAFNIAESEFLLFQNKRAFFAFDAKAEDYGISDYFMFKINHEIVEFLENMEAEEFNSGYYYPAFTKIIKKLLPISYEDVIKVKDASQLERLADTRRIELK